MLLELHGGSDSIQGWTISIKYRETCDYAKKYLDEYNEHIGACNLCTLQCNGATMMFEDQLKGVQIEFCIMTIKTVMIFIHWCLW